MIHIAGLGPGNPDQLTKETIDLLGSGRPVYLRTAIHPTVAWLNTRQIQYTAFDDLYDTLPTFEAVYGAIVSALVAAGTEDIVYAVPGNPLCGESTVMMLLKECQKVGVETCLYSGVSFIDACMAAVAHDPVAGLAILDAYAVVAGTQKPGPSSAALITQVHSPHMASETKLALMDIYADHVEVALIQSAGTPDEVTRWLPLYQMDREFVDHLTTLYIPAQPKSLRDYTKLLSIMERLRAPGGCPWDREQTHESLKQYLLEETYEVIDAIEADDLDNLIEELGDLLLQIVFHAQLGKEEGLFTMNDIIEGINEKMVRRHVHIFGDAQAETGEDVEKIWAAVKQREKGYDSLSEEMSGIPMAFPALLRAYKIQSKAGKVGFDWGNPQDALPKVAEEMAEVEEALAAGEESHITEEIGDLLFAAVNVARLAGVQPELALNAAGTKFIQRFKDMEKMAMAEGQNLENYDLAGLDTLWEQAKALKRE